MSACAINGKVWEDKQSQGPTDYGIDSPEYSLRHMFLYLYL
jgi:hypothetical protein